MSVEAMRQAIENVAVEHNLSISVRDIEALAQAAADAETWWNDDQLAEHLPQRKDEASRRDWCAKYDIERVTMVNAQRVRDAIDKMPGHGWHGRRTS